MRIGRALFENIKKFKYQTAEKAAAVYSQPTTTMMGVLKDKGSMWLAWPFMALCHYWQYTNDVYMVAMVKYKVKLYPEKPKIQRLRF